MRTSSQHVRHAVPVALALLVMALVPLTVVRAQAATVTITDVARSAGVYDNNKSWSACETPGGLLYVGDHQKSSHLYQSNLDGTYATVPNNGAWPLATPSTVTDRHGCAWADFDHNGLMDMANSAGRNQSNFVKPTTRDNELWLQTSVNRFTDVGTQVGIADPCGRGRHEAAADFNGDGWADLVVGNAIPRNDTSDPCNKATNGYPSENPKLYYNLGDPEGNGWNGFAPGIDLAKNDDPGQRCMEAADLNHDGHVDLIGCRLKNKPPEEYLNDGTGKLVLRSGTQSGLTSAVSDVAPYDIDGDGNLDLAQIRKTSCGYQLNDGTGKFTAYRSVLTFSNEGRAVAIGETQAGLAMYCQVQANSTNPTDYVGVRSGTTWAKYAVPAAGGLADEAYAIHPNGPTGFVQFLVLNGGNGESGAGGPVQLIRVASS